jgi:uncharacterized protein
MATTYLSPGVYVEEVPAGAQPIEGVGTAVAAFVGLTQQGPVNEPVLVTNWGQFTSVFGDFLAGSYLPLSVYQFFNNGGGSAWIMRVGGADAAPTTRAAASLRSAAEPGAEAFEVRARIAGAAGDDLSVEVIHPSAPAGDDEAEAADTPGTFTVVVRRGGDVVETFDGLQTRRGRQYATQVINERSQLIERSESGSLSVAERLPAPGPVTLSGGASSTPATIEVDDYAGDPRERTGIGALEAIEGVTMVCVPDLLALYQQGRIDLDGVRTVQRAMVDHCENMGDRIAILDTPPGFDAQQVRDWRMDKTGFDSPYATMYWPWVKVFDPATSRNVFLPPSGAMAGIWGRTDSTRGVHKAPANEVVRGALDVERNLTRAEHDQLNPIGVNVIRAFPGRGIRVWGARTLASEPAWRYLNVRRLFNYLESSILLGTQWMVFEPNDKDLWDRAARTIRSFLYRVWRSGALFGQTPDQAYYVKCDAETNPPEVIDAGQVVVEIGVAPVKPAEFVVFRLAQLSAGGEQ